MMFYILDFSHSSHGLHSKLRPFSFIDVVDKHRSIIGEIFSFRLQIFDMAMRYVHAHTAEVSVRNSAPPLPAGTFYAGLFAYVCDNA